jgi:Carboxypeptidase regulatory-like domain
MRRLSIAAAILTLAACGGGSETGLPPSVQAGVSTRIISGTISSSAGEPLQGVQVLLGGAGSGTVTTSADGAFQFVGLPDALYTVTPSAAQGPFTPANQSVTLQGQSAVGLGFMQLPPPLDMQQLASHLAARHASDMASFQSAEVLLSNNLAASGTYQSGAHYSASQANVLAAVQSFTTDAIGYIRGASQVATIDRSAVAALLNSYETQDATFEATYYRGVGWGLTGAGLDTFIANTTSQSGAIYAQAVAQIP